MEATGQLDRASKWYSSNKAHGHSLLGSWTAALLHKQYVVVLLSPSAGDGEGASRTWTWPTANGRADLAVKTSWWMPLARNPSFVRRSRYGS